MSYYKESPLYHYITSRQHGKSQSPGVMTHSYKKNDDLVRIKLINNFLRETFMTLELVKRLVLRKTKSLISYKIYCGRLYMKNKAKF